MALFGRLRESLSRTKQQIVGRFEELVRRSSEPERRARPLDVETVEGLEELLISADIGVAATDRIVNAVKAGSKNGVGLRELVKAEMARIFQSVDVGVGAGGAAQVTLVVGVTG